MKTKTKQQLAEEIKALQDELDAMPEVGINYKPKWNELYFVIHADGEIESSTWRDDDYDKARYACGNCYPTREAAERIVRNRQTLVKLREFAFVPDWEDCQPKYAFCMEGSHLNYDDFHATNTGSPAHFAKHDLKEAARDAVGEAAIVDMLQGGLV